MIDTVIFDIGNVLTAWHWRESFTEMFGEALVEPLADATVRSPGWYELDRGALSEDGIDTLLGRRDALRAQISSHEPQEEKQA